MKLYRAKLKSRKRIMAEIPREQQGWWADVCAGQTLTLRDATEADVARCSINEGQTRDPADYFCEACERGSLVRRIAVEKFEELPDRRTAPSAPMGEELPVLPPAFMDLFSPTVRKAWADQMRQYAQSAIAPYAARIRQLERELSEHKAARIAYASEFAPDADGEPDVGNIHANIRNLKRELAERKTASIDTPEFRELVEAHVRHAVNGGMHIDNPKIWDNLIAYIDGRTAGAAPDARVEDLAMLVRLLVRALSGANPDNRLIPRALDYLKRNGLAGSPLRSAPTPLNSGKEEA